MNYSRITQNVPVATSEKIELSFSQRNASRLYRQAIIGENARSFLFFSGRPRGLHTHTHTHTYVYLFIRFSRKNKGRLDARGGSPYDVKCVLAQEAGTFADVQLDGRMYDVHRILAAGYIGAD